MNPVAVVCMLLGSLNSCTNPWIYLYFSGTLLNQLRVRLAFTFKTVVSVFSFSQINHIYSTELGISFIIIIIICMSSLYIFTCMSRQVVLGFGTSRTTDNVSIGDQEQRHPHCEPSEHSKRPVTHSNMV